MERNAQVERELQQIKDRLLLTESQLDEERHARNEREERVRKSSPHALYPLLPCRESRCRSVFRSTTAS